MGEIKRFSPGEDPFEDAIPMKFKFGRFNPEAAMKADPDLDPTRVAELKRLSDLQQQKELESGSTGRLIGTDEDPE